MAVIVVVGDFSDTKSVVDLIKTHFGSKVFATDYVDIPRFLVPSHEEPRISCFMESEAAGVSVIQFPINCSLITGEYNFKICKLWCQVLRVSCKPVWWFSEHTLSLIKIILQFHHRFVITSEISLITRSRRLLFRMIQLPNNGRSHTRYFHGREIFQEFVD
ncbi:uncharacterized protein LOC110868180 [Helianthus annuus]|uniref:uncharacterized protein LOC110868180 n=1 Tax=Helianthus annuus TaxID=4232 RepID=UPI0016531930|nr:uncharacterized protein LOC110868180 [Helianthus annuus]XP_035831689.1 uncharacterized protein LOC110868180 [Helianthus annuus]